VTAREHGDLSRLETENPAIKANKEAQRVLHGELASNFGLGNSLDVLT